jgi:GNAT superfamily N-acetyltransferase
MLSVRSRPSTTDCSCPNQRIQFVSNGRGQYLIAELDGTPVGHGCLWPMALKNVAHVLQLHLCVHHGHWSRGFGQTLLSALLNWAHLRSHHPITRSPDQLTIHKPLHLKHLGIGLCDGQ